MGANSELQRHWPAERDVLLKRHPRESWGANASLDVAFWLEVHRRFRHECAALQAVADDYRQQRLPVHELAIVAAPRLSGLLTDLRGHHQVEDFHYFPAFRRLAPQLAVGIDLLEHDHTDLDEDALAARNALRELRAALAETNVGATAELAAQQFVTTASQLCLGISQHLNDEEDLVIPLLLEQEAV
ncbi:MAG: hemerythrin domain-containing protein [Gammaproteobacteria bacterium]